MSQPFFVRSLSRAERKAIQKLRKQPQTSGIPLWSSEARFEASSGPKRRPEGQKTEKSCFKKTKASAGRCAFAYCDEAEFHLNPGLSRCWSARGRRVIVP
jgi:transposase